MRKTYDKDAYAPVEFGDPQLSGILAQSLQATTEVDRWTHGFHTYPAGLHPDGAAALVGCFPGASVLDPFCGGGTVLVEAMAAGRAAFGRDASPVATMVASGRTALLDEAELTRFRSAARRMTAVAREAQALPSPEITHALESWYAPYVLCELESLRASIEAAEEDLRPLLWLCFSSLLVKVSWRRSDTSNQRVKHRRPPGTTAVLFHKKARELARRLTAFREGVPREVPKADIRWGDARRIELPQPVDLVLTSPPYPSTYDYLAMQHLRAVWLGLDVKSPSEIGSRRDWRNRGRKARKKWSEATERWTVQAAKALNPGGHLVVVIGDGLTPAGTIDTSNPTERAARVAGLVSVARASVERTDHARERTRWEHVFAFQKPFNRK